MRGISAAKNRWAMIAKIQNGSFSAPAP